MFLDKEALEALMAEKSDEDLANYINNVDKYTPEAIKAAIAEFKKRGRNFSNSESEYLESVIQEKLDAREREFDLENPEPDIDVENIVTDPTAPGYYSKKTITVFSLAFSVLAGSILLVLNIRGNKIVAKLIVLVFGILYTSAFLSFLVQVEEAKPRRLLAVFFNFVGAMILNGIFWNKYLGENTLYRAKFTWQSLLISIIVSIPFLLVVFFPYLVRAIG